MLRGALRDRLFKSDTRTLTIPLAVANFAFVSITPVLPSYQAGSSVNLYITIKNNGNINARFDCKIYDTDTNAYLAGFGDYLDPGASLKYTTLVGTMPAHDWHLRVDVSP